MAGIPVEIVRKRIKNLHLAVYPPDGRVRIAVPTHIDDDAVRVAVSTQIAWIHRQQARMRAQPRQSARDMVTGESHYVDGRRYLLRVVERPTRPSIRVVGVRTLEIVVRPGTERDQRLALLERWYRKRLREQVGQLVETWEPVMGVTVEEYGIRKMKTRWGSCNPRAGRIWLSLELAKKSPGCVEYVVVHEMVHLLERKHDDRFRGFMDQFLPTWRLLRDELNRAPLAHEDWEY